ncbi:hypothetical protein PPUJ20028_12730 [Pseudomonas putida]|uniref:Uncharacterized protein n=1 Tax=Pseudomonas putida TaxID=303 RepID=A0AA37R783_PSEPU|nr:hypothetical protein PPUJ20028_12730 [Pseudomonas putida]GLO35802.1 hypothetical protein PPUN14671_26360 [Pseudomonas putida]
MKTADLRATPVITFSHCPEPTQASRPDSAPPPLAVTLQVVSIVLFTFIGYLNIGIPLPVLPGYVHNDLGFSAVVAGLYRQVRHSRSH